MRAMPLAFPGNALVRDFETQFMCGDALLVAPIVREGGEVEIALPPGGMVRPQYAARVSPAGRCFATARSSISFRCSAAKATRCRSAAPSSIPARSTATPRSSCSGCSASRSGARRLFAGGDRTRWRGRVRRQGERRCGGRGLRRRAVDRRAHGSRSMSTLPAIAVTCGEPAGIGPELLADARRAACERPCACASRLRRRSHAARAARRAHRAVAALRRLRPRGSRAVAARSRSGTIRSPWPAIPGHPDRGRTRGASSRCSRTRATRARRASSRRW